MMTFRVNARKVNKQKGTRLKFNLEKLKDPNIHKTFQAMIGGKFAPLTILKDTEEGEDLDTRTRNFSTAITDTAVEILGKHRTKKKKWITDDILEMCDKRRELKNKKHDAQGRSQYREINNKIRKAIKQAKENWIEQQCEKNLYEPDKEQHKTGISDCKRPSNHKERKSKHHPRQVREKSH